MDLVELRMLSVAGLAVMAVLSARFARAAAALSSAIGRVRRSARGGQGTPEGRSAGAPAAGLPVPGRGPSAVVLRRQAWWRLRC